VRAALALDKRLHLGVVRGRAAERVGGEHAHAGHLLLEPPWPAVECTASEIQHELAWLGELQLDKIHKARDGLRVVGDRRVRQRQIVLALVHGRPGVGRGVRVHRVGRRASQLLLETSKPRLSWALLSGGGQLAQRG